MMKIDLTALSNADLSQLIREASTLLSERLTESSNVAHRPAPIVSDEPPADEKDFCLYIKSLLRSSQYVKAEERRRVAEIAEKYGQWVRRQGLPTQSNTGPWRAAGQFLARRRAPEV